MLLSRRNFLAAGVALPVAAHLRPAKAATKIRYLLTSPVPDVGSATHSSVPKALGYWPNSGLDVEITPFTGASAATQVVLSGRADFTMASPEPLLVAKQEGGSLRAVYNYTREPIFTIAVEKSSPIQKLEDLKGKTIGLMNLSGGAFQFSKAMLSTVDIDPQKDIKWLPVGLGPQTANALQTKKVDAIAYWDQAYASLENMGYEFRHFITPKMSSLLGFMLIGNENFVNENSDATIKMAQGIAKSVIFTRTNPEAAVRLHWEAFPASKPTNVTDAEAIAHSVHVLKSRLDKYRIEGRKTEKWGYFEKEDWTNTQSFFYDMGLLKKQIDVDLYYTNRFVEQINQFDPEEIVDFARNFKQ